MLPRREEIGELLDFIERLRRAPIADGGRDLLSLLANNRSISEDAAPQRVIRALERLGVLVLEAPVAMVNRRRNALSRRYPLARRWSQMFDAAPGRTDCPSSRPN
jgi:hypothetical protein